ncbi:hypothetical protein D3C86_1895920 [compost metagenome]
MPARLRDAFDHKPAQFGGQGLEVCARKLAQVGRVIDGLQQGKGHRGHLLFF